MNIVPATREYMDKFFGFTPKTTVRAWAFEQDGVIHGVVGMCITGYPFHGFLGLSDEYRENLRRYPRPLVRVVKQLQNHASRLGIPVVVDPEETIPEAVRFIEAMGFENQNGVYVWH